VSLVIGAVLTLSPILTALGLLTLAEWRDRRRATAIAWQVRLTDAISMELGGVVAPVVSKPLGVPWRVAMHVPVARPALVSRILAITHATLRDLRVARYELVLTPEPAVALRSQSTGLRPHDLRAVRAQSARSKSATRAYGGALTPEPAVRIPTRPTGPRRSSLATS
jgi:hypothetical protein